MPVKLEDVIKTMDTGMRDVTDYPLLLRNGKTTGEEVGREYLNVAMAPWIRQALGKPDLMDFSICMDCARYPETGKTGPPAVMLYPVIGRDIDIGTAKKCLMDSLGNGGKAVEKRIDSFLSRLYASKWESTEGFLSAFASAMDKSFGKLKKEHIDGY